LGDTNIHLEFVLLGKPFFGGFGGFAKTFRMFTPWLTDHHPLSSVGISIDDKVYYLDATVVRIRGVF
jgi:hypothetical protein